MLMRAKNEHVHRYWKCTDWFGNLQTSPKMHRQIEKYTHIKKCLCMLENVQICSEMLVRDRKCTYMFKNVHVHTWTKMNKHTQKVTSKHLIERHLIERHFIERHLIERHLIKRHLIERRFIERHFIERQFI